MKNIQTHVYIPEDQMEAIRIAAKEQLRTPQNLLTFLLLNSPEYQRIVQGQHPSVKTDQPPSTSH